MNRIVKLKKEIAVYINNLIKIRVAMVREKLGENNFLKVRENTASFASNEGSS